MVGQEEADLSQEQSDAQEAHYSRLFTDQRYFDSLASGLTVPVEAKSVPNPEVYAQGAALTSYLDHVSGSSSPDPISAQARKNGYAVSNFGKEMSDGELFGKVREQFVHQQQLQDSVLGLLTETARNTIETESMKIPGIGASIMEASGLTPVFAKWVDANKELIGDENHAQFLASALTASRNIRSEIDRMGPDVSRIYKSLATQTKGEKGGENYEAVADSLAAMDKDDRKKLFGILALSVGNDAEAKGYFEKLAESFGRGIGGTGEALNYTTEDSGLNARRRMLLNGDALIQGTDADLMTIINREDGGKGRAPTGMKIEGPYREPTKEETSELVAKIDKRISQLQVVAELQDFAKGEFDPVKATAKGLLGMIEQGTYGAAESAPYTALALVPGVGIGLTGAAIYNSEYRRIRLAYPDMAQDAIPSLALTSTALQAPIEWIQSKALLGKLPATGALLKKMGDVRLPLPVRLGVAIGGNTAEQNIQEAVQDSVPVAIDAIASAVREDMPEFDFKKEVEHLAGSRVDTFFALLPLAFIGGAVDSVGEIKRGAQYLKDVTRMTAYGIAPDRAKDVAAISDPEERLQAFRDADDERVQNGIADKDAMQEAQDRLGGMSEAAKEFNDSLATPKIDLIGDEDANGNAVVKYRVSKADGTLLIVTADRDVAEQAALEEAGLTNFADEEITRSFIQHFQGTMGQDIRFEVSSLPKTGQDAIKAGETSPEKLRERMTMAGWDAREGFDKAQILGETTVQEISDGLYQAVAKLHAGHDVATVVEEANHGFVELAIKKGTTTLAELQSHVEAYEKASGEKLLTGSRQGVIEAVAKLGEAYLAGRVREKNVPQALLRFFHQMTKFFREAFVRAVNLDKAISEGKVSGDFESFLAESVGLSSEKRFQNAVTKRTAEHLGISETSHSIASPEQIKRINAELDRQNTKAPKEKFETLQRAKRALINLQIKHAQELSGIASRPSEIPNAEQVDETAALASIEGNRAAELADIEAEEEAAVAAGRERVLDKATQAKGESEKAFLKRVEALAKEREAGIRATYKEKKNAVNQSSKEETARVKSAATEQRNRSAQDTDAKRKEDNRRAVDLHNRTKAFQAVLELESILKVLPPEVAAKVGGFTTLAKIGTGDKALSDFFIDRFAKINKELERVLSKEYQTKIAKLFDKTQPEKGENKIVKSKALTPDVQRAVDRANDAQHLTNNETSHRGAEIEGVIAQSDLSPEELEDKIEEWGIVNMFGDLPHRNSLQLEQAYKWLNGVISEGKKYRKFADEARLQKNKERRDEIISANGAVTKRGVAESDQKGALQSLTDFAKSFAVSHYSFSQVLESMLPGVSFVKEYADRVRKADNAMQDMQIAADFRVREVLIKAVGSKSPKKLGDAVAELSTPVDGKMKAVTGRKTVTAKISIELAEKIAAGEFKGKAKKSVLKEDEPIVSGETLPPLTKEQIAEVKEKLADHKEQLAAKDFEQDQAGNENTRRLTDRKPYIELEFVTDPGREEIIPFTPVDAIQFVLGWQQPDSREKMIRDGWTEESFKAAQEMVSSPLASAMLEHLREEYAKNYDTVNPIYRKMFNMDMPRGELYAPTRYRSGKESGDIGPFGGPLDNSGVTPGFAKARVSHSAPWRQMSALLVYRQHVSQVAHWVHFAEITRELRAVLTNREVMDSFQQRFGNRAQIIQQWVDALATGGGSRATELMADSKMLDALISAKAISAMGGNIRTIFMQADSMLRFIWALPADRQTKAVMDMVTGSIMEDVPKAWNSDSVQRRVVAGSSPETRYLYDNSQIRPGMMVRLAHSAMMPIQYADAVLTSISSAVVYRDAYRTAKDSGLSDAEAEAHAGDAMDDAVYRYSQPTGLANRSLREISGNRVQKILMMFLSDPRLKTAVLFQAVEGLANKTGDPKEHARRIAGVYFMANVAWVMGSFMRDILTDQDDEEIWTWGSWTKAMLLAPFSGLYLAGAGVDIAMSRLLGQQSFNRSENPLVSALDTGMNAFLHADDVYNFEDPDAMMREWNNIARSVAIAGPVSAVPAVLMNVIKAGVGATENLTTPDDEK